MRTEVDVRDVLWAAALAVGLDVLLILGHPSSFCSGNGDAELRRFVLAVAGLVTLVVWVMAVRKLRWVKAGGQRATIWAFAVVASGAFALLLRIGVDIPAASCA